MNKPWTFVSLVMFAVAVVAACAISSLKGAQAQSACFAPAEAAADPTQFPYGCNNGASTPVNNPAPKKKAGGGGASGPKFPCTSYGDQEKALALQALQAGNDVTQVAAALNAAQPPDYKSLPGDTACVAYPDGPYVGCREFYPAGPDDGSFTADNYQSHPDLWFAVSRCDPSCTDPKGCMP
jgi:hypothetical protein